VIRVLIADANPLFRIGVRSVLGRGLCVAPLACECGEAGSEAEVMASLRAQSWHLFLMNIALPRRGALEVLRRIRSSAQSIQVLLLSAPCDRPYARMALQLGVRALVRHDCSAEELLLAVRAVASGGCYVGAQFSNELTERRIESAPAHTRLSERELQVFQKLARGTAITVISRDLSISEKSVSTYRTRILQKMGYTNNSEMTRYALCEGLI
jgi:two-component system, NarL family, invasion response regulator UvrY